MRDAILQRTSRFIIYIMALSIPLVFTWRTYDAFTTPKEFIFKIGVILLTSLFLFDFLTRNSHEFYRHPLSLPLFLFWLWGLISALFSARQAQSLNSYVIITSSAIFFYLIPYILKSYRERRIIFDILILVSIYISILTILQYLGLFRMEDRFSTTSGPLPKTAIYSTLGNPNFIGSFLIGIAPIILVSILSSNLLKKIIHIAGLVTLLVAIIILRSKGSYVGLIFSSLFLFWLLTKIYRKRRLIIWFLLSFTVISILSIFLLNILLPGGISPIYQELKGITLEHATIKGRLLLWHTALLMIKDHPILGIGPDMFGNYYQLYRAEIFSNIPDPASIYPDDPSYGEEVHAHNEYIQVASETGIIGLVLFLWLIYRSIKGGLMLFNSITDRKERLMVAGLICGVIAILTHALVEFPLHLPATGMLFWLMLGIIFSIPLNDKDILEKLRHNKFQISNFKFQILGSISYLISLSLLIIGSILIFYASRIISVEILKRDAWSLMNEGKWHDVIPKLREAIDIAPIEDGSLHFYLGVSYTQTGRYEDSVKEYKIYYDINPDFQVLYNIGVIYHRLKRYDLAKDYYLSSLRFKPSLWEAYLRLAEICTETGEMRCGSDYYQKAKRINPRL